MNEAEYLMKNYGDRGECYPSRPYLLFYSFKIIPSLKTWLKRAYLHRSIDVKFMFDRAHLGLFSFANILQIEDVALRVVLLLFLPCF